MREVLRAASLVCRLGRLKILSEKMAKIKAAIVCLNTIKLFRSTALHIMGMFFSMTLFISGLIVMHLLILFFAPWPEMVRVVVSLTFALIYIIGSIGLFLYLLSQRKWMELFQVESMLESSAEK